MFDVEVQHRDALATRRKYFRGNTRSRDLPLSNHFRRKIIISLYLPLLCPAPWIRHCQIRTRAKKSGGLIGTRVLVPLGVKIRVCKTFSSVCLVIRFLSDSTYGLEADALIYVVQTVSPFHRSCFLFA